MIFWFLAFQEVGALQINEMGGNGRGGKEGCTLILTSRDIGAKMHKMHRFAKLFFAFRGLGALAKNM